MKSILDRYKAAESVFSPNPEATKEDLKMPALNPNNSLHVKDATDITGLNFTAGLDDFGYSFSGQNKPQFRHTLTGGGQLNLVGFPQATKFSVFPGNTANTNDYSISDPYTKSKVNS